MILKLPWFSISLTYFSRILGGLTFYLIEQVNLQLFWWLKSKYVIFHFNY